MQSHYISKPTHITDTCNAWGTCYVRGSVCNKMNHGVLCCTG